MIAISHPISNDQSSPEVHKKYYICENNVMGKISSIHYNSVNVNAIITVQKWHFDSLFS